MRDTPRSFEGDKLNVSTLYSLSIFASLAYKSYEVVSPSLANIGFTYLKAIEDPVTMTQGYVAASKNDIVVFFRGTRDRKDILTDINILKVPAPSHVEYEKVHKGFMEAWKSVSEITSLEVTRLLEEKKRRVWFTGHSLGAAIAGIAAYDLQENNNTEVAGSYLFGMPRMANKRFAKRYNSKLKKVTFRIVNNNDIVARVPLRSMGYQHVGVLYIFDSDHKLKRGISWLENTRDRLRGRLKDAFDGDLDGLADHAMALYSAYCLESLSQK